MTRECQVRICERLGVKLPGPTRRFAGLNLIQHLRDAPVNIVLVDRCNHHFFQPLLYDGKHNIFRPSARRRPPPTPVHKVLR
jgi:hypothetical protein